jgi:hypothetical protein
MKLASDPNNSPEIIAIELAKTNWSKRLGSVFVIKVV